MQKRYTINPKFCDKVHKHSDCIVIGSGIAGLFTAIKIAKQKKVKIITKSSLKNTATWYAQGGIAAAVKKPDNWKKHYQDSIIAGGKLCDKKAVEILVKEAPDKIQELMEIGVEFDARGNNLSLTREGGHSEARVLHAGGDVTGREIEAKLLKYCKNDKNIKLIPNYFITDIVTKKGAVCGVLGLHKDRLEFHPASSIVIATGGIGQVYELTTNPENSTGDGIAIGHRAGAKIADMEFVQFHPTVYRTKDNKMFLITEALRGEGAYLRDIKKQRFMEGRHPQLELAPRDIVVKEMISAMKKNKCNYIYIDATHLPKKLLKERFPNIIKKLKKDGLDLSKDLIKVFPAAHYLCGGIITDHNGKTNIQGLFCCGEAARTGVHGANRLASNSLMESVVFGARVANSVLKSKTSKLNYTKLGDDKEKNKARKKEYTLKQINDLKKKLRRKMINKVGILRSKIKILEAKQFIKTHTENKKMYDKKDKDTIEFINMLTVGALIANAALKRKKSLGTHIRKD